jgi:amylosucrase
VAVDLAALGLPADARGTISSGVDDTGSLRTLAPWATLWIFPEREPGDA